MKVEKKYYVCDRCGKTFNLLPGDMKQRKSLIVPSHKGAKVFIEACKPCGYVPEKYLREWFSENGIRVDFIFDNLDERYDLCRDCAKELKEFLSKK